MNAKLEVSTFLWSLLAISVGFLWMIQPFFAPIFWACALAIIYYPLHLRLLARMPYRPNAAALISLFICVLVVILPVVFIVVQVVNEAADIYSNLEKGAVDPARYLERMNEFFPQAQQFFSKFGVDVNNLKKSTVDIAMSGGKYAAQHALTIGQNAAGLLLDFALMMYLSFFMLRDGEQLLELLVRALPIADKRERQLFALFGEVTRATVKGNLVVALVQGALGGLILAFLGMQGVLLWAVLMAFASLIPALGPALVWVPISLYLFGTGQHWQAAVLVGFGVVVIGTVDNILRPILVGRDTQMPDYMVLLSTLGGIALFGINGVVVGPLVAALFMAFWAIFMSEREVTGDGLLPDHGSEKPIRIKSPFEQ
ncbi:MAG TPA: AI-2E family transporter [Cellvibrionaceae bacterium]